jgi:hypothetical protein
MYISIDNTEQSSLIDKKSYSYESFLELTKGLSDCAPKTIQIKGTNNIFTVQNISIVIQSSENKTTLNSSLDSMTDLSWSANVHTINNFNQISNIIQKYPNKELSLKIIVHALSKDIIRDTNITNTIIFDNNPQKIWGSKTYSLHIVNNSISIVFNELQIMYHFFDQINTELCKEIATHHTDADQDVKIKNNFDARFKTQNIEQFISHIENITAVKFQKSRLIDIFLYVIRSQQDVYKKTFDRIKLSEKHPKQDCYVLPHMLKHGMYHFYFIGNSLVFHNDDLEINAMFKGVIIIDNSSITFWVTDIKKTILEIIGICIRIARVFRIDNNLKIHCPLVELFILQYMIKDLHVESLEDAKQRHELNYIIENIETVETSFVRLFIAKIPDSDHVKNILTQWIETQEKLSSAVNKDKETNSK